MASDASKPVLIIGCGALAREIQDVCQVAGFDGFELTCLPADYHNRPEKIAPAMDAKIIAARDSGKYAKILALYGDCGTGGELDRVLDRHGVERIAGDHCYGFYAGVEVFDAVHDGEPGTFYLTDYLVRFFDTLVIKGLGLDRHPDLRDMYFGNYTRLLYLAQTDDPGLDAQAKAAADRLGLHYERRVTGLSGLTQFLQPHATEGADGDQTDRLLA